MYPKFDIMKSFFFQFQRSTLFRVVDGEGGRKTSFTRFIDCNWRNVLGGRQEGREWRDGEGEGRGEREGEGKNKRTIGRGAG